MRQQGKARCIGSRELERRRSRLALQAGDHGAIARPGSLAGDRTRASGRGPPAGNGDAAREAARGHRRASSGFLAIVEGMRCVRLLALLSTVTLLPACPWIDLLNDDSATDGLPPGWETTGGGPTEGGGVSQSGGSEPTTTGIVMTGADNDPEQDGCPCAQGTELIYLLSDVGALWSFDPKTGSFGFIADVDCGGMIDTYSMGVSRKGRAWIQYMNGDLYTVDLNDPGDPIACKDPGFSTTNPAFKNFGMAFVANSLQDPCDKLYAHSGIDPELQGKGVGALGVIDPISLELSMIAPIDFAWGELTGTATGRLFAFQGSAPALLTEYDKSNGAVIDVLPLPGLKSDSAFAFAWWGGDFYLFTDDNVDLPGNSQVWHLDYDDSDGLGQQLSLLVSEAPLRVVGAGVSTCAPPDPQ